MRFDEGRIKFAIDRGVEGALVADQDVDGLAQRRRGAHRIVEPDRKIPRRGRHGLLRHRPDSPVGNGRRIFHIHVAEEVAGHRPVPVFCRVAAQIYGRRLKLALICYRSNASCPIQIRVLEPLE